MYGAWNPDDFWINGLAAYTHNHYSSDRDIVFPGFSEDARGGTHGNQATLNLDGGYDWHVNDRLIAGPLLGLQWVHMDVDGFNESGAGAANLGIGNENIDSIESRVGGRANYHLLTQAKIALTADFHAAWQHEYLDNSRGITTGFSGSGLAPFSVQTSAPLRDAAVLGAGLDFSWTERFAFFADYELLMWSRGYLEQTINGGGRIRF